MYVWVVVEVRAVTAVGAANGLDTRLTVGGGILGTGLDDCNAGGLHLDLAYCGSDSVDALVARGRHGWCLGTSSGVVGANVNFQMRTQTKTLTASKWGRKGGFGAYSRRRSFLVKNVKSTFAPLNT